MEKVNPVEVEERKGWKINCPFCSGEILYTKLVNWESPTPFFYCNSCNDVLLRKSDKKNVELFLENGGNSIEKLEKLWGDIAALAPVCQKGGRFSVWSNIKCPHCMKELPYNNGVRSPAVRINEKEIILVDSSSVIGDTNEETWQVRVLVS